MDGEPIKRIRVRGLVDCAGAFGNLNIGIVTEIPVTVYEGLRRAEYVEPVDPADEQALLADHRADDGDEGDDALLVEVTDGDTVIETKVISLTPEKKETRRKRK